MKKQQTSGLDFLIYKLTNSVENAPFDKGKAKMYAGIAGNLSFLSKSQLIDHYRKTLGAIHFGGRVMIIETKAAINLIDRYFKNLSI